MNIFWLDEDPIESAAFHCDKHCVKMVLEYAQLLCTAHRVLDGEEYTELSKSGRKLKRWKLDDAKMGAVVYNATHVNHPCAIWAREVDHNYYKLFELFECLCDEYTARYGKVHLCDSKLREPLRQAPDNILTGPETPPPLCMPDECKIGDAIESYREYYRREKSEIATWTYTWIPTWFHKNSS